MRHTLVTSAFVGLGVFTTSALCPAQGVGGLAGGGPLVNPASHPPCVTDTQWVAIQAEVAAHSEHRRIGPAGIPSRFRFYPMAGTLSSDTFTSNYVDLNPLPGFVDFRCDDYTYDGHDATDVLIRTFEEQSIGVPIYAAQDGVVVALDDGHPDQVTQPTGNELPNFVAIDHGNGRVCYYLHMKRNSVAVGLGQNVVAGQQIGLVGSSGNSTYPHLHFATYDNGSVTEPFSGLCRPGTSGWVDQPTCNSGVYLQEFAVSRVSLAGTSPPAIMPRTSNLGLGDNLVYLWVIAPNLPPLSTWQVKFYRPSGTVAFNSGPTGFNNPTDFNWSWWWWSFNVTEMHTTTGTWEVELLLNGVSQVRGPIEVLTTYDPGFNRPPEPITVALEPAQPAAWHPIRCVVTSSSLLDDLDYDVVSFRYEWFVNGQKIRDVTSAARSDVLPAQAEGNTVTCRVTPQDAQSTGSSRATPTVVVRPLPWTDLGFPKAGSFGNPVMFSDGDTLANTAGTFEVKSGFPLSFMALFVGFTPGTQPFMGGVLVPTPPSRILGLMLDGTGCLSLPYLWPPDATGLEIYFQGWILDPGTSRGVSATNALQASAP